MLKTVSIAGIEEQGVPFKRESTSLDEATQHVSLGNLTWICLLYTSDAADE